MDGLHSSVQLFCVAASTSKSVTGSTPHSDRSALRLGRASRALENFNCAEITASSC